MRYCDRLLWSLYERSSGGWDAQEYAPENALLKMWGGYSRGSADFDFQVSHLTFLQDGPI